jgi:ubiquitin C-terminal hydrolase
MGENCSFCKRTSKKNEIMKIASLPKVLIISLQRINPYNGRKNDSSVKFYEGIDLREIIDAELSDGSSTKYNLFAVSNHVGEINSGHYYSYIKIGKDWFCFEDSKVYKIGYQINMNTSEVYTLFYSRSNY